MIRLLRVFDFPTSPSTTTASWELAAALCYYSKLYGVQIVLVGLLSALTVYRREISCNHVYNEGETTGQNTNNNMENQAPQPKSDETETTKRQALWNEETAEELLEGAGSYCSGEPLLAVALSLLAYLFYCPTDGEETDTTMTGPNLTTKSPQPAGDLENGSWSLSSSPRPDVDSSASERHLTESLPAEIQIYLLSYLHPRELVSLAACSKTCRTLVDEKLLWKTLWRRDYGWLLTSWNIGRQALQRSARSIQETPMDKTFYFVFGQAYTNYVLAGCNTDEQCLVSLHGHIYDLTPFLNAHPGSPDTLMVHAGREATRDFERMNHSAGARRLAQSLCVVVNPPNDCAVHPTRHTTLQDEMPCTRIAQPPMIPMGSKNARPRATLYKIRSQFEAMEAHHLSQFTRRLASNNSDILGDHINVYYDPLQGKWKAWYTNLEFDRVFVE